MYHTKIRLIALSAALCTSLCAHGQTAASTGDAMKQAAPDNSRSNKVDPSNATTAQGQSNDGSDLQITKQIRQSVVADKSLSTYAHNVKIVTVGGAVTLNGVVKSDQEKSALGMKAAAIVGADKVTNVVKISP